MSFLVATAGCLVPFHPLAAFDRAGVEKPYPTEYFSSHSRYEDIKISPDGKHILAHVTEDDTARVVFINLQDNEVVGGIKPRLRQRVAKAEWVGNDRVIYTVEVRSPGRGGYSGTGKLYSTNISGSDNKLVAGIDASDARLGSRMANVDNDYASYDLVSVLKDDDKHVLVIEYPWTKVKNLYVDNRFKKPVLKRLAVSSGTKVAIETLPFARAKAFSNRTGAVNILSVINDRDQLQIYQRNNAKKAWEPLALKNASSFEVLYGLDDAGEKLYLSYLDRDKEELQLAEYDLASGKTRIIAEGYFHNISFDHHGRLLHAVDLNSTKINLVDSQSVLSSDVEKLIKAFPAQYLSIRDVSKDGTSLIIRTQNAKNPGETFLFDTKTKQAHSLAVSFDQLDLHQLQDKKSGVVKARDGLALPVYLTQARGKTKGLVTLIHDAPFVYRDHPSFDPEVQYYANNGYNVLQVNYRGSNSVSPGFEQAGYKEWGGKISDDIIDAINWAHEQGYGTPASTCTVGSGFGAFTAMSVATIAPSKIRCVIAESGFYDISRYIHYVTKTIPIYTKGYLDKTIGDDKAIHDSRSPVRYANKVKADVLLIAPKNAMKAWSAMSKDMYSELKKTGNKVRYTKLRGIEDPAMPAKHRKKLYETRLNFLNEVI